MESSSSGVLMHFLLAELSITAGCAEAVVTDVCELALVNSRPRDLNSEGSCEEAYWATWNVSDFGDST
jgi:hypothetical protein